MRRTLLATAICLAALSACLVALLVPIHTWRGESCGTAYVAGSPPVNDDSWYSTCAELRDQRRGNFTLPAVLASMGVLVCGGLAVRRRRELTLGL
jgi:hypothetical protein